MVGLGGIGFAAPALQLAARDQWIGWNKEERQAQLHSIVGMSRFFIFPSVSCKNLASKVLGMSMATIADDFDLQYGYRPLLIESFVDTEYYSGTCYQAANWLTIDQTKGRGRQDRYSESALSQKTIYMYPLKSQFRKQLGLSANAGLGALDVGEGLEAAQWAEHEFGKASIGDLPLSIIEIKNLLKYD